jgi:hypothetical protein
MAAAGQAPSDPMRGALAVMPQAVVPLEGASPLQVEFGNPRAMEPVVALQSLRGELSLPPVAAALSRSLSGGMRNATLLTEPEAFEVTTGLRLTDLGQMLSISRPPARVDLVSIAPDAAGRVIAALTGTGHQIVLQQGNIVILARGEEGATDPTRREVANPFGGPLGQSTRFLVTGGVLVHAPAMPMIEAVAAGATPRMIEHPGLAGLLAGLDAAAAAEGGAGELVHAMALLGENGRDLLVADLANGAEETGILVIGAPDTAEAQELAARLSARFDRPVTIAVHPGTPASVTLRATAPRDFSQPIFRNRTADEFRTLLLMGDLEGLIEP